MSIVPKTHQKKSHQQTAKELRVWLESDHIKETMSTGTYSYFDKNIKVLERPEPLSMTQFHKERLKKQDAPPEQVSRFMLKQMKQKSIISKELRMGSK